MKYYVLSFLNRVVILVLQTLDFLYASSSAQTINHLSFCRRSYSAAHCKDKMYDLKKKLTEWFTGKEKDLSGKGKQVLMFYYSVCCERNKILNICLRLFFI